MAVERRLVNRSFGARVSAHIRSDLRKNGYTEPKPNQIADTIYCISGVGQPLLTLDELKGSVIDRLKTNLHREDTRPYFERYHRERGQGREQFLVFGAAALTIPLVWAALIYSTNLEIDKDLAATEGYGIERSVEEPRVFTVTLRESGMRRYVQSAALKGGLARIENEFGCSVDGANVESIPENPNRANSHAKAYVITATSCPE